VWQVSVSTRISIRWTIKEIGCGKMHNDIFNTPDWVIQEQLERKRQLFLAKKRMKRVKNIFMPPASLAERAMALRQAARKRALMEPLTIGPAESWLRHLSNQSAVTEEVNWTRDGF